MMFLKLTQWHAHRYDAEYSLNNGAHGRKIYVNVLLVTDMFQFNGSVFNTKEDQNKSMKDRPVETYTELYLCVRGEDGQTSRCVQETPEQIVAMIEERL